jgi:hypothetical protein
MYVTRENAADLIAQGLLPQGDLVFEIRSGAEALPLPSLFKMRVRWSVELEQLNAIVTEHSDTYPAFTFFEWHQLEVDEHPDGITLRFVMQSVDQSMPVEVLVMRTRASGA